MGPGLLPTFLYYFVGTTLIAAFVVAQATDTRLDVGNPYQVGILFGLLAGGVGTYFNRYISITLSLQTKAATRQLETALSEMGYAQTSAFDDYKIYERPIPSKFFSGKFILQFDQDQVAIAGRASSIKALQRKLTS